MILFQDFRPDFVKIQKFKKICAQLNESLPMLVNVPRLTFDADEDFDEDTPLPLAQLVKVSIIENLRIHLDNLIEIIMVG